MDSARIWLEKKRSMDEKRQDMIRKLYVVRYVNTDQNVNTKSCRL